MKKKLLYILITIIILISFVGCSSNYSIEEAMVKKCYETIKDILLNPDSLVVYKCYGEEGQSEEQRNENFGKEDVEKEYDLYHIYFYIGAENKMGGMTDIEYAFVCDKSTGEIIDWSSRDDYDAGENIYGEDIEYELAAIWLNIAWAKEVSGFEESWTDYKELILSDEFEKIDYEKILQ